ncbi:uncharacterized mitochondrial protein AtMg00810-like [Malania oleifera]|uniref:uncharacterized mitochondrial protein AtMg00810-like n=1 Tax=Malania oleifera TaxID=397392 RepID=UPI0025ADEA78|nr:uncharacterized mitochondrial protein AtMg00810-like [Malania oleifera]
MHAPCVSHWQSVKHILRYLKHTLNYGLLLQSSPHSSLAAYTDADWAGCPDDRKSTGGYCIFYGCNLVSWSSKKQSTIARSGTEAEYKALALWPKLSRSPFYQAKINLLLSSPSPCLPPDLLLSERASLYCSSRTA